MRMFEPLIIKCVKCGKEFKRKTNYNDGSKYAGLCNDCIRLEEEMRD